MKSPSRIGFTGERVLLFALVAAKLVLNLLLDQRYGYFRDEFYYLKLGEHVFDGPTAMPLLGPLLMALSRGVLGDSLIALHVLPALAGAGVIVLTVWMARDLGGRLLAQGLAGIGALLAPAYVGVNSTFSYDSFDQLFWVACLWVLVRLLQRDKPRLWLAFGAAAGLGLFTKETMLFLGFAVALAFLLTPARRHYMSGWMWAGAGISFLFAIPYLVMQGQMDWPCLDYWSRYGSLKTYAASPLEFVWFQVAVMNPVSAPLWLAGLVWALGTESGKPFRALGWAYLILVVLFVWLKVKFYFLVPMYAFLFAAGAAWIEGWAARGSARMALRLYLGAMAVAGIVLAPYAMPLLPLETFLSMARATGGDLGVKQERHPTRALPQHFADRFGWEELARLVVAVYQSLPPADRAKACVFTANYGQAGAIEFFGRKLIPDLPPVLSAHGQYFFWGCGDCTGEVMILVGVPERDVGRVFERYAEAARTDCEYAMPYENGRAIYVARGPKVPLAQAWPGLAHFD